jgi:hypothetical protein
MLVFFYFFVGKKNYALSNFFFYGFNFFILIRVFFFSYYSFDFLDESPIHAMLGYLRHKMELAAFASMGGK